MATIVVAHGAWSAGWAWKKMRPLWRARGHEVFTPTYTGLGERAHLAAPSINLDTHIRDTLNVLEYEDLSGVVLVGHSYGGMVATGVADRARDRIRQLIYLDAFVPEDGKALHDYVPAERREAARKEAIDGLAHPAAVAAAGHLAADVAHMVARRMTGADADVRPGAAPAFGPPTLRRAKDLLYAQHAGAVPAVLRARQEARAGDLRRSDAVGHSSGNVTAPECWWRTIEKNHRAMTAVPGAAAVPSARGLRRPLGHGGSPSRLDRRSTRAGETKPGRRIAAPSPSPSPPHWRRGPSGAEIRDRRLRIDDRLSDAPPTPGSIILATVKKGKTGRGAGRGVIEPRMFTTFFHELKALACR